MAARASTLRNDYRCSIEKNQNGKYCVRIHVRYPRHAWTLGVFFLAGSFDRAADLGFSAEFLREAGLKLDRRTEFPPKSASLSLAPEREVPAFVLGTVRRGLAESVSSGRVAAAGD